MENIIGYVVVMRNEFGIKAFADVQKTRTIPEHVRNAEVFPLVDDTKGPLQGEKFRRAVESGIRWEETSAPGPTGLGENLSIQATLSLTFSVKELLNRSSFELLAGGMKEHSKFEALVRVTKEHMIDDLTNRLKEALNL